MKLSVVIPNYNGKKLLETMLPELKKALKSISDSEIMVYDNNSSDDSRSFLTEKYPTIHLLKGPSNDGFTRAINQAVVKAKGEMVLILNNDCFVSEKTLLDMLNFLKKHPEYSATQPVVKSSSGKIENIGFVVDLFVGKARVITDPKDQYMNESYMRMESKTRYLYGLSATCLLIKRDDFIDTGMFDESFHSYLEDVDLVFRLIDADKKYFPTLSAECIHQHMGTSSKMGSYKQQRDFLNWIRIIIKNYPNSLIVKHFGSLCMERLRNLNGLLKRMAV